MESVRIKGWLLIGLVGIGLLFFSSNSYIPNHSIFNEGETGASYLKDTLELSNLEISRLLVSPFGIGTHAIKMMVIIGSHRTYTSSEIDAYRNFVDQGGTLIVFEDFGPAQKIAESMGINYLQGVLTEPYEQRYVNNPTQFLVKDLTSQWFGYPYELYLMVNRAAGIIDLTGMSELTTIPLLLTLPSVFLDVDADNIQDRNDFILNTGTPVGLMKFYGSGLLAVISDASIPLNLHYNKAVQIVDTVYNVPNLWWSSTLLRTVANFMNTTSIVFDESHQQLSLSSTSGILNFITGFWVGVFNSGDSVFAIFLGVVVFAAVLNRDLYWKLVLYIKKVRYTRNPKIQLFQNPTLIESDLAEQFLLYNTLGNQFLHVANLKLYKDIKETGKGGPFLSELENTYGKIDGKHSYDNLLEIHRLMRNHVDSEITKWL